MPVGTRGAVKGVTIDELDALGAEIMLANTYHLHLRPGDESDRARRRPARVHGLDAADPDRLGRLSGLQSRRAGARSTKRASSFSRTSTAARMSLSPESAVDIQARLGSDVAMMFDECTSWPATHDEAAAADAAHAPVGAPRARSVPGARRRRACRTCRAPTPGQAQFGIIQGGTYKDLRDESVAGTRGRRVRGLRDRRAVGGRAVRGDVRHRRPHGRAAAGRPRRAT